MFEPNQVYNRRHDLHAKYLGQQQGGISTPKDRPFIMLFTGESGEAYGYKDGWTADGKFLYTGEGQYGDMTFVRGNKAILDHAANGKDLHLFKQLRGGQVQYIGQMICVGHRVITGPDRDGVERRIIQFELARVANSAT